MPGPRVRIPVPPCINPGLEPVLHATRDNAPPASSSPAPPTLSSMVPLAADYRRRNSVHIPTALRPVPHSINSATATNCVKPGWAGLERHGRTRRRQAPLKPERQPGGSPAVHQPGFGTSASGHQGPLATNCVKPGSDVGAFRVAGYFTTRAGYYTCTILFSENRLVVSGSTRHPGCLFPDVTL